MINPDHYFVNIFHHISLHLPVSADAPDAAVIHIAHLDAAGRRAGVHDLVIAYVDAHMPVVADHVSRHLLGVADRPSASRLGAGSTGQGNPEMGMHRHGKPGAVRAVGQAGALIYVRVAHKLQRVGRDG